VAGKGAPSALWQSRTHAGSSRKTGRTGAISRLLPGGVARPVLASGKVLEYREKIERKTAVSRLFFWWFSPLPAMFQTLSLGAVSGLPKPKKNGLKN
jgi:hypothetical protein